MDASWVGPSATGVFTIVLAYLVWPLRGRVKDIENRCSIRAERTAMLEAHYMDIKDRLKRIEHKIDCMDGAN